VQVHFGTATGEGQRQTVFPIYVPNQASHRPILVATEAGARSPVQWP
jgi:hypothetical protein